MVSFSTQVLSWMTRGMPISGRTFLKVPGVVPGMLTPDTLVPSDHVLLNGVRDHVSGCLAGIDIKTRDAHGMVVIEHQPGTLRVGIEESQASAIRSVALNGATGIQHVRHIPYADALGIRERLRSIGVCFSSGRNPLVSIAVADPDGVVAVVVDSGPVLRVLFTGRNTRTSRPVPGTHNGFVHRQEEVTRAEACDGIGAGPAGSRL